VRVRVRARLAVVVLVRSLPCIFFLYFWVFWMFREVVRTPMGVIISGNVPRCSVRHYQHVGASSYRSDKAKLRTRRVIAAYRYILCALHSPVYICSLYAYVPMYLYILRKTNDLHTAFEFCIYYSCGWNFNGGSKSSCICTFFTSITKWSFLLIWLILLNLWTY